MRKQSVKMLAIAGLMLLFISQAQAALDYNYIGEHFNSVLGSAQVTTANSLSGFVTFATAPLPNQTGKNDVVAFSITDGARTLSSVAGDHEFSILDFFDFDGSLNIVNWRFSAVPGSESTLTNAISTTPTTDLSLLDSQDARNTGGGSWVAVPEPASWSLLAVGLTAGIWRKRR